MAEPNEEDLRVAKDVLKRLRRTFNEPTAMLYDSIEKEIATALAAARAEGEARGIERAAERADEFTRDYIAQVNEVFDRPTEEWKGSALGRNIRALSPAPDFFSRREDAVRQEVWKSAERLACNRIGVMTNGNESWLTAERVEMLCDDIREVLEAAAGEQK